MSRDGRVADSERCSRVAWFFQDYRLKFASVRLHHVGLEPLHGSDGFCHKRVYDLLF